MYRIHHCKAVLCYGLLTLLGLLLPSIHCYALPISGWTEQIKGFASKIDFQQLRDDEINLEIFFSNFPKGANLHHHYSGGIFPEDEINKAISKALCMNMENHDLINCTENSPSVVSVTTTASGENEIIKAWSITDETQIVEDRITKFFGLFKQLGLLFGSMEPDLLAITLQDAAKNKISHLETMVFTADFADLAKLIPHDQIPDPDDSSSLKLFHDQVTSQAAYQTLLTTTLKNINTIVDSTRNQLKCNTHSPDPACDVSLSLLAISDRLHALNLLYVELIFSFDLAQHSMASGNNLITGVNLVGLESQLSSAENYEKQMKLLAYLKAHTDYPLVRDNISLHAGELCEKIGPYELLTSGLHETVEQVSPSRIGHGVSINQQRAINPLTHEYINVADQTAELMAKNNIAVEVPLTSNKMLLNIYGNKHPLMFYKNAGVPVVLATDDPGILMTTMTKEFVHAALSFPDLTLMDFIEFARNSLEFSFMAGDSLWQPSTNSSRYTHPVKACRQLMSVQCNAYTSKSPKAKLQQRLEINLLYFLSRQQPITRVSKLYNKKPHDKKPHEKILHDKTPRDNMHHNRL